MSTVVTAATGRLGRLVVRNLLDRGVPAGEIVATGRRREGLLALRRWGVSTCVVDHDDPQTLRAAFVGARRVLLISGDMPGQRVRQHQNVVDAAVEAGVERFVYTSILRAGSSPLLVAPDHRATEQAVAASGLDAVVLRNGWYHENLLPEVHVALRTGVLLASAGAGRVASAARADYAEAAAVALVGTGVAGLAPGAYELGGDRSWDYDELAQVASTLRGRLVRVEHVDPEEHCRRLIAAGMPVGEADLVVGINADIARGLLDDVSGTLRRIVGHRTTRLAESLAIGLDAAAPGTGHSGRVCSPVRGMVAGTGHDDGLPRSAAPFE